MNFCGGGVEQQVHEPPIVSMARHRRDDNAQNNIPYHHQSVDLPVHPSCMVKSSQPQNPKKKKKPTKTPPRRSLEDGIRGMEITTPQRQSTNLSTRSSPSPRMLNPLSPQRVAGVENTGVGVSSFSNMKTLDTLLKRLENGFRVVSVVLTCLL